MLLYFLGASKLTMLYVIVNAVAAIAGKALVVGKVALAIATAIALKKIFGKRDEFERKFDNIIVSLRRGFVLLLERWMNYFSFCFQNIKRKYRTR